MVNDKNHIRILIERYTKMGNIDLNDINIEDFTIVEKNYILEVKKCLKKGVILLAN